MPHYEFSCHACKQAFSKILTPAEYAEGSVVCPHCGSEEVEQRVSAFYPANAECDHYRRIARCGPHMALQGFDIPAG
jgi:putative FmdB family regulatory protein